MIAKTDLFWTLGLSPSQLDLHFIKDVRCGEHSLSYFVIGDGLLHTVSCGLRARCQFSCISVQMRISLLSWHTGQDRTGVCLIMCQKGLSSSSFAWWWWWFLSVGPKRSSLAIWGKLFDLSPWFYYYTSQLSSTCFYRIHLAQSGDIHVYDD